jgi:hypothetical protein
MAEITGFWQSNLRDLLAELGEERTSEILSAFECPLNPDVQSFLREKAILFSKHGYASTYLVFASYQGSVVLIGYYALAMKAVVIKGSLLSSEANEAVSVLVSLGLSRQDAAARIKNASENGAETTEELLSYALKNS